MTTWIALRCDLEQVDTAARPCRCTAPTRKRKPRQCPRVPGFGYNRVLIGHTETRYLVHCKRTCRSQSTGPLQWDHLGSRVPLSFVIIRCPRSLLDPCWCAVGAVSRYSHFWYRLFGAQQPWQILVRCVLVNTLQYHDTVDFVQDSETDDPQLVAEKGVGRNHCKTMGKRGHSSGTVVWTRPTSKFLSSKTGVHVPTVETRSSTLAGNVIVAEEPAGWMALETAQRRESYSS